MPPQDTAQDMRSEMLAAMAKMGVKVEKHHHEVGSAQHELGMKFSPLTQMADQLMIYKYCIQQVAQIYGKTATFMPKPIYGDNGSGMHCHQSIWKGGKPAFAGNKYADLSEMCLSYIAGILKHARSINAFTNPTTNSYKRLVPGFEAPVLLAYSQRNRSASCRIPYTANPKAKRVEVRFPDPLANPYLAFAAMTMAGLDGIKNKLDPGSAVDKDLYDLPPAELKQIPTVCGSLREALGYLDKDRAFLKAGGVFDDDFIDSYIDLKMTGSDSLRAHPASGRVRHVLLGVSIPPSHRASHVAMRCNFGRPARAPDFFAWTEIRRSERQQRQALPQHPRQSQASGGDGGAARRRLPRGVPQSAQHRIRRNWNRRRPALRRRARHRLQAGARQLRPGRESMIPTCRNGTAGM